MAEIIIQEKENVWQGTEPAEALLQLLEHNPFGNFQEMSFDGTSQSQPYQSKKALNHLGKGKTNSVRLKTEVPIRFRGAITRGNIFNTVVLGMPNPALKEINLNQLVDYVSELARLLPNFTRVQIYTDYKLNEYYESQDLPWLPECFGNLVGWYYLISPLGYSPYFSREEMLNIPAHQVRELENGWIEVISYPDPLAYDQPEARAGIITITNYLNTHRRDWQKAVAEVS